MILNFIGVYYLPLNWSEFVRQQQNRRTELKFERDADTDGRGIADRRPTRRDTENRTDTTLFGFPRELVEEPVS